MHYFCLNYFKICRIKPFKYSKFLDKDEMHKKISFLCYKDFNKKLLLDLHLKIKENCGGKEKEKTFSRV